MNKDRELIFFFPGQWIESNHYFQDKYEKSQKVFTSTLKEKKLVFVSAIELVDLILAQNV